MALWSNKIIDLHVASAADTYPIEDGSVHCVVTSPPYWGLRDYGSDGQIGLEPTPEDYCLKMVEVFREVRRVLRDDGTVWLNLGDSYSSGSRTTNDSLRGVVEVNTTRTPVVKGIKEKDLVGMPWRVAFALQADGWYLRCDIIWSKPNPMPESVTDRPTKSHEYIFLLTKQAKYYYDADAIRESLAPTSIGRLQQNIEGQIGTTRANGGTKSNGNFKAVGDIEQGRNKRSVWEITTQPYKEAHFATFPGKLVEPCILAGTSEKGVCAECGKPWERVVARETMQINRTHNHPENLRTRTSGTMVLPPSSITTGWTPACSCNADTIPATVLDPFVGSGTTMAVAQKLGRHGVGLDLNEDYVQLAVERLLQIPLPLRL